MAETGYYYKRIEAAISDFKSITASLRQLVEGTGFEGVFADMSKDAGGLDRQCESVWLNGLEDYKKSNKLESLNDFQKEEVALQNKEAFDFLVTTLSEHSEEVQPLLISLKALKDTHS